MHNILKYIIICIVKYIHGFVHSTPYGTAHNIFLIVIIIQLRLNA